MANPTQPRSTPHSWAIDSAPLFYNLANYPFTEAPLDRLPFVGAKYWNVEPTDDHSYACDAGNAYAAHYIQYLHDNPVQVGFTLTDIAREVTYDKPTLGYAFGFFGFIEEVLFRFSQDNNIWAYYMVQKAELKKTKEEQSEKDRNGGAA